MGVPNELRFKTREMLEEERGQVSIFTEMQDVDAILPVVLDKLVHNEQGLVRDGGSQAIEGETTRQIDDRTEKSLECFGHVIRDKVFIRLKRK